MGGLSSVEQLLAARQQLGMGSSGSVPSSGNYLDRVLAQRMAANAGPPIDQSARSRESATGGAGETRAAPAVKSPAATLASGEIDPELFKLYLLEQERKMNRQRG